MDNILKIKIKILIVFCSLLFLNCVQNSLYQLEEKKDYREEMRSFVIGISNYAKQSKPNFIIIPQNGHELLTDDGKSTGNIVTSYINAIDGVGREDLYYGYNSDDVATPVDKRNTMVSFMNLAEANGVEVLVTDYCSTHTNMDDSYAQNNANGYVSFAAESRELDMISTYPATPYNLNANNISNLTNAQNFLYLINPDKYDSKEDFLNALKNTNYDILLIDLFFDETELSRSDISSLKTKSGGGSRLVIAYMSIGEAEDYRYYWQPEWSRRPPSWLYEENPDWKGNYKVKYWDKNWKEIIFGDSDSYLDKILNSGFDGVYLDIIDAFEYFEDL